MIIDLWTLIRTTARRPERRVCWSVSSTPIQGWGYPPKKRRVTFCDRNTIHALGFREQRPTSICGTSLAMEVGPYCIMPFQTPSSAFESPSPGRIRPWHSTWALMSPWAVFILTSGMWRTLPRKESTDGVLKNDLGVQTVESG